MNESAATKTPVFGSQLSWRECSVCAKQVGVARPAQCGAGELGETSLGGGGLRAGNARP